MGLDREQLQNIIASLEANGFPVGDYLQDAELAAFALKARGADPERFSKNMERIEAYREQNHNGTLQAPVKSIGAYANGLWGAVRNFYLFGDVGAFIDTFNYWITEQLNRAWREGARDVGVYPEDFEEEDYAEIARIISSELDHVLDLASAIEQARVNDDGYQQFRSRVDTWTNRYNDVVNQARVWFGGKMKLKWVLGATEQHCASCSHLNGIVAYAREWDEAGIRPQSPPNERLSCGGWKCDCSLIPTDERKTRGALERIRNTPKAHEHDHENK